MKKNGNQLAFEFETHALAPCDRFECEHAFYTDADTEHQVCEKCSLCVPHEYILDKCVLKDWPEDE